MPREDICPYCHEDKYSQQCPHFNTSTGTYNPIERTGESPTGGGQDKAEDKGDIPANGAEDIEWVTDETTNAEYLNAIYNAYSIAESYNAITKADTDRINRIKKRSLRLADTILSSIFAEFITEGEREED